VILDELKEGRSCETPEECIERLGLRAIPVEVSGGDDPVTIAAREALAENPHAVNDFKNGRREALNFLVGQVMKKTRGCAKPADVNQVLVRLLQKDE